MPPTGDVASLAETVATLASEVRDLRRRLVVMEQAERFRDVVLRRFPTQPWAQPARARLDAGDAGMIEGLYFLEFAESGRAYRWTGPDHLTRFRFNIDRSAPVQVWIELLSLGRNSEQAPLTIGVEGTSYPLLPTHEPERLLAGPLPPRDGHQPTELVLHVPVLHCPQDEGSSDSRRLGVAITGMTLEPLA